MMQGSDWPIPTAPRLPETARERLQRAAPAIAFTLLLHATMAWWLLRAPAPWQRTATTAHATTPATLIVEFNQPAPAPSMPTPAERIDAVPFPTPRPSVVHAVLQARTPATAVTTIEPQPATVDSTQLFGDIAGVASDIAGQGTRADGRVAAPISGRAEAFIDAGIVFKPPPPSPERIAIAVMHKLMSTRGATNVTDFMGITEGRDPGREIQRAHHTELHLPRGCDDPDDPNTSDECMGIPKK